jgi:methylated-DNA-[protein]-cysteine S-methyltransferase
MSKTYYTLQDSPIGELLLTATDHGISGLYMQNGRHAPTGPDPSWQRAESRFTQVRQELDEYFAGQRRHFGVALDLLGTAFQRSVWQGLCSIAYGATESYATLAHRIGNPKAVRAVGLANGRNPVSIIVPCHRVIGSDGSLTGYGGGLERKRFLLEIEARQTALL